jgi:hypothetical protein
VSRCLTCCWPRRLPPAATRRPLLPSFSHRVGLDPPRERVRRAGGVVVEEGKEAAAAGSAPLAVSRPVRGAARWGTRWAGGGRRWRSATRGRRGCTRTRTSTSRSCAASSSRPSSRRATRAPTTRAPTSKSAPSASWSVPPKPCPLLPPFHSAPTHDSRFDFDLAAAPCSSTRV